MKRLRENGAADGAAAPRPNGPPQAAENRNGKEDSFSERQSFVAF
jgi:hypothetical protein